MRELDVPLETSVIMFSLDHYQTEKEDTFNVYGIMTLKIIHALASDDMPIPSQLMPWSRLRVLPNQTFVHVKVTLFYRNFPFAAPLFEEE